MCLGFEREGPVRGGGVELGAVGQSKYHRPAQQHARWTTAHHGTQDGLTALRREPVKANNHTQTALTLAKAAQLGSARDGQYQFSVLKKEQIVKMTLMRHTGGAPPPVTSVLAKAANE